MEIERVLEKLESLLSKWSLSTRDWILIADYARKLLGYDVKFRRGHLNIVVDKSRLPWQVEEELESFETQPSKDTDEALQCEKFCKKTGFEFDIIPFSTKVFRRKTKDTIGYILPNKKTILIQTPLGALDEFDLLLSQCNREELGEEKGVRILSYLESLQKELKRKGETKLAKSYRDLIRKYLHLKKLVLQKSVKGLKSVSGIIASRGMIRGKVNVVLNPSGTKKFDKGSILVAGMTSPKFSIFVKKASGIITDEGGMLCHAAIISREFGVPCLVGTKVATKIFKDGDLVELNCFEGIARKLGLTEDG
jgi:phosphohistidine swiveling domain-containing protein